ncbi:MAG: tetraacyldisaccharide 4'-kinase [Cyclobacteriaceae bacterium]|nr:tetraacyldisaccharide 4'-kinase [Cyclobacteriaceae bacterium]
MIKILKLLLYPFAALYNLATRIRNYLYDIGHKPSFQFDTTVIVVGNLNVGGSGKTPMVEYLIQLLRKTNKLATLSRGYKRDTQGYRAAENIDTARSIGDEPFQLFRKFGNEVKVVVGEDRVFAIPNMLQEFPETNVILLDDALQNRSIKPQLSILVTECSHPFYEDFVMPFGRLREARSGAKRSDIIVVTKCKENISQQETTSIQHKIQQYTGPKPVFFSGIRYKDPEPIGSQNSISKNVILVTGIAKTGPLKEFCISNYKLLKHFNYTDHHPYSLKDMKEIETFCKSLKETFSILTTEKDMVKLLSPEFKPYLEMLPWFYLPIEQFFIEDGLKFDELVVQAVKATAETN